MALRVSHGRRSFLALRCVHHRSGIRTSGHLRQIAGSTQSPKAKSSEKRLVDFDHDCVALIELICAVPLLN
jgi:hypothetical protein